MIWNILLFLFIGVTIYLLVNEFINNETYKKFNKYLSDKNDKYYKDLLKYYDKNKKVKLTEKINYFRKVGILIDRCGFERNILISPITILLLGIVCVILSYMVVFNFFKIMLLALIISIPTFYLPTFVLEYIADFKEEKIEKVFLNFLLQLKNHTKINNDIVSAMQEVKTIEPLQGFIKKFLIEISSGVKFENAINNFKEKINIKQIKSFLENLKHCYLYGGDFSKLIDKNYEMISDIQSEKSKRITETKSARIVLFILIGMDLLVYMSFVKSNAENYAIMQKTIAGNIILYWNFISMWILVWLSNMVKKLDY